jgi:hypothetical protein
MMTRKTRKRTRSSACVPRLLASSRAGAAI